MKLDGLVELVESRNGNAGTEAFKPSPRAADTASMLGRLVVAVVALGVLAGGCGGEAVTREPESASPVVAESSSEQQAWDELSDTLGDLNTANQQSIRGFEFASELGLDANMRAASVPWLDYQNIAKELRRWHRRHPNTDSRWHDLALAGAELSDAAVRYASNPTERRLNAVVDASAWFDALVEQYCEEGEFISFIQYCG